jgi:hypothetical protein
VAKNGRKDKAIALVFKKSKKWLKMDEKIRLYSLTFLPILAPFSKIEKVAKNGGKVKAIALLFCCFLPLFQKPKNLKFFMGPGWAKKSEIFDGSVVVGFGILCSKKKHIMLLAVLIFFRNYAKLCYFLKIMLSVTEIMLLRF